MYLILAPGDKRIMHISKTLDYNFFGGYVLDSGLHIVKGISEAVEVDEILPYVEPEKYCYINNEFVYNVYYGNCGKTVYNFNISLPGVFFSIFKIGIVIFILHYSPM